MQSLIIVLITIACIVFLSESQEQCGKVSHHSNLEVCTAKPSEFTAAVVEHCPVEETNLSPDERLKKNAEDYIRILNKIDQNLDIIVFPEATLYANVEMRDHADALPYATEIPNKITGTSLCSINKTNNLEVHPFLADLACAAQKTETYVVVNLVEKAECDDPKNCAEDGWNLYNTNVVLDRDGAFVSRYRKFNLFGEFYMNQTTEPDISIFETDFGIKFGMFTCFDILFRKPTLELIEKHNVRHLIFPSMWFSELPFLTALQTQHMWAQEQDVVLLASGANHPRRGSGGTGIYLGKYGPLDYGIVSEGGSQAYVATITSQAPESTKEDLSYTDKIAKEMDNFLLITDDLKPYSSKLLTPNQQRYNEQLCSSTDENNKICCNFNIEIQWNDKILNDDRKHYQYHIVAYSGVRSFTGMYNGGIEICGVVACTNDEDINSCTERFKRYDQVSWPATFKQLSIKANFTIDENRSQHPNSLLSSIRPLPVSAVEWSHRYFAEESMIERSYYLEEPQNRLLTFAIYGRDFNRDGPSDTKNTIGFNSVNV